MKNVTIASILGLLLFACSPQKRLNRLIKNHPELAKTDTIYTTKPLTVPGYRVDTNFKASTDVSGLTDIINHYRDCLDSIRRTKLTQEVKTYILDRNCLQDTFKIALENNGICKVWQKKGVFYYQLHQPAKKYTITVPVQLQKFNVTKEYDWVMYWIGVCTPFVLLSILAVIAKIYKVI